MLKSISIATKIGLALSILVAGYTVSMIYGVVTGLKTDSRAYYVAECLYPASILGQNAVVAFDNQNIAYFSAMSEGETSYIDNAEEQSEIVQQAFQKITELKLLKTEKKKEIELAKKQLAEFSSEASKLYSGLAQRESVESVSIEDQSELSEQVNKLGVRAKKLKKTLRGFINSFSDELKNELDSISSQAREQLYINIAVYFAVVGLSLLGVWFIVRQTISRPLKKTVSLISEIASGDLTRDFHSDKSDEVGQIIEALSKMVVSLKSIINMVAETTKKTSTAALEISAAVEEQAAVTSQQSSSVTEITATMEELSITTTQVAEYSNSVAEIAGESLSNTKIGAESVELVMNKMTEINTDNQKNIKEIIELGKKSEEINKVMIIINNIADQTKLIAFNAALEASSAGEAGKRFGVVAAEIRRLADSVIVSTGETENKIKEIQDAVNNMVIASEKSSKGIQVGLDYSTETAQKLGEIVTGAQETADAAKQISLSTQQELSATEQVLTALKEIELGAKQAASSIGQIGFISKDLEKLSKNLTGLIDQFKLVNGE